ncbi:hypothetical protein NEILACOT_03613 [Neisseria lactamica ATCC 23970]|uniref:Uncharacterized protein n=1 Tax=Neisseria lactamica ATCC 23970 TaxID=546265 RepID=D0W7W3_NEILA|nr:hypothetical protein NEILACOT_03613 [Neisseria lactamica ATCC 23970]
MFSDGIGKNSVSAETACRGRYGGPGMGKSARAPAGRVFKPAGGPGARKRMETRCVQAQISALYRRTRDVAGFRRQGLPQMPSEGCRRRVCRRLSGRASGGGLCEKQG